MRALLICLLVTAPAFACLHYDKNFKYKIKEGTKAALLFHDGKNAHLVVRTDVSIDGKGKLPGTLSWVMPFPSLPSKYEEVSENIFTDIEQILQGSLDWQGSRGYGGVGNKGIKVHETKIVGNYKIEPIEITSDTAGNEFNDWLTKRKLNPMPAENQKYYLKKGAVFLAITAKLGGTAAKLKPLHIVYKSDQLSFPMKFTHDTRVFDLDLYVIAGKLPVPLDYEPFYLELGPGQPFEPTADKGQLKHLLKLVGKTKGSLFKMTGRELNKGSKKLAALPADPSFTP